MQRKEWNAGKEQSFHIRQVGKQQQKTNTGVENLEGFTEFKPERSLLQKAHMWKKQAEWGGGIIYVIKTLPEAIRMHALHPNNSVNRV